MEIPFDVMHVNITADQILDQEPALRRYMRREENESVNNFTARLMLEFYAVHSWQEYDMAEALANPQNFIAEFLRLWRLFCEEDVDGEDAVSIAAKADL